MKKAAIIFIALTPAWTLAAGQFDMETLFYTPQQRADISRARQEALGTDATATAKISGVVRRAGGKSTVWVNGKPIYQGSGEAPELRGMDAVVDGTRLRVGESLDKTSGERTDVVAPGAVTARKKP